MSYRTKAGRQIDAAYYKLSNSTARIVWFDENGDHDPSYREFGHCTRPDGKPVIITKPGDTLCWDGVPFAVLKVHEYPFK